MKPRPFLQLLCRFAACAGILLLATAGTCRAQFSFYDASGAARFRVSPYTVLLTGLSNVLFGGTHIGSLEQSWDAAGGHYRGNLLTHLYYPQLPKAGYRSFSLTTVDSRDIYLSGDQVSFSDILAKTEAAVARDNRRTHISYHYDSTGWLRAVVTKTITPEYEGYAEITDSLFYSFRPDGSVQLRWQQESVSSGRGNSGTSECPPMSPRYHIFRKVGTTFTLDPWHNITAVAQRTEERRDTCQGAPKTWLRTLAYDAEGKLLRLADTSFPDPSPTAEVIVRYETVPYSGFAERVRDLPAYAPFREAVIRNWLSGQGDLTCIIERKTGRDYVRYDPKVRRHVLRPDSPYVGSDSAFAVLDRQRRRVVYTEPGNPKTFSFYIRGTDSATGLSLLRIQNIPAPDPAASGAVVCNPLAVRTSLTLGRKVQALGADTLTVYATDEHRDNYGSYSASVSGQSFSPVAPRKADLRTRHLAFTDRQGLLRYLWLDQFAYKLTYQ